MMPWRTADDGARRAAPRQHGFDDIVVTVAFLANQIRDYFGDGSDFGVRMRYATGVPLGTPVRLTRRRARRHFLVISGDVLTDIDSARSSRHTGRRRAGVDRAQAGREPLEFAIVITRPDGSIERFLEKPSWGEVFSDTRTRASTCSSRHLRLHPRDEVVDFAGESSRPC